MLKKVFLNSVTHYHPETKLENRFFERYLETTDEWIQRKVGIRERRWMADYTGSMPVFEISKRVVEKLLSETKYDLSKIDMIISCSSFEDLQYPGPANLLSEHFNLAVPAFHLKNGCSTVLYAIQVASGLLQLGVYKNILLVNGEPFTRQVDYSERSCILFGDGASAMVVSTEGGSCELMGLELGGAGSQLITSTAPRVSPLQSVFKAAQMPDVLDSPAGCFRQDGRDVYDFVINAMPKEIEKFLRNQNSDWSRIHYFIGHQANYSMLKSVCEQLKIPDEKHLSNIEQFGNVSSSGWATVLSQELGAQRFRSEEQILISVFGAGMAWGTALLKCTREVEEASLKRAG